MFDPKQAAPIGEGRTPGQEEGAGGGVQLYRNVQRFRGGLVFKAHRLLYHTTLGLSVIKKRREEGYDTGRGGMPDQFEPRNPRPQPQPSNTKL